MRVRNVRGKTRAGGASSQGCGFSPCGGGRADLKLDICSSDDKPAAGSENQQLEALARI
jgi:hypothetical protein